MLNVSRKCQYALRALLELAIRYPENAVTTVSQIAEAQKIPPRFLEQILSKLRTGGYIESRRGNQGGYIMSVAPSSISVGDIIRFMEGSDEAVDCLKQPENNHCPFLGSCAFKDLWQRAHSSLSDIFDNTNFQDLIDNRLKSCRQLDYTI
jgi:Rrf2 family protein